MLKRKVRSLRADISLRNIYAAQRSLIPRASHISQSHSLQGPRMQRANLNVARHADYTVCLSLTSSRRVILPYNLPFVLFRYRNKTQNNRFIYDSHDPQDNDRRLRYLEKFHLTVFIPTYIKQKRNTNETRLCQSTIQCLSTLSMRE